MCTEEFIRMMFTVDLYGNRGLDSRNQNVHNEYLHTTLYGSAAGCRSIQKTCAFWKNGLTFENTQSQLTYICKSNINQTFTNGNGMIWGVMLAIFTEILPDMSCPHTSCVRPAAIPVQFVWQCLPVFTITNNSVMHKCNFQECPWLFVYINAI